MVGRSSAWLVGVVGPMADGWFMGLRGRGGGVGYLRLLRRRSVLVLWGAQSLSVLGDRLYALAGIWLVWDVTRSGVLTGLVAVAESVPYVVLGAWGRRLVARFSGLGRLAWVDGARAVALVGLVVAWRADGPGVAVLLGVAALLGVLGALFDPNLGALVPEFVERGQVQRVTGLMDITGRLARVVGPGAAGALLVVMPEAALFAVDAGTFAVSAVALAWLARHAGVRAHVGSAESPEERAPRAWPVLRVYPRVAVAIGLHGAGLFVSAVSAVGVPMLMTSRMGAGAGGYALVAGATGVGALLGNPVAGQLRAVGRFPGVYCLAWAGQGAALALMGLASSLPVLVALAVVSGVFMPIGSVSLQTHLGATFTGAVRLRVMASDHTVIRAAGLSGMVAVPPVVAAHPSGAFVVGGVVLGVVALSVLFVASRLRSPVEVGGVVAVPGEVAVEMGQAPR